MHHGEDGDLVAEQLGVEQGPIAGDVTGALERPYPTQARRRRNANPASQLDVGHAAVRLQFLEDLAVNGIESGWHLDLPRSVQTLLPRKWGSAKLYC